jgi:8-oxo-dGTP pyrophosphatase MutT (NUDIX family)
VNDDLPAVLSERLKQPLPGAAARAGFQPELSYGRHFGPAPSSARPAAVLVLLYPLADAWHIPLTLRPADIATHAGQISLPGGLIEPGERSEDAALRELREELGTTSRSLEVVGELSPIHVFVSNYLVMPWVAVARSRPDWDPNPTEVAEVLEVPLARLLDPAARGVHMREVGGVRFAAPCFIWARHRIWGATCMILAELLAILGEIGV